MTPLEAKARRNELGVSQVHLTNEAEVSRFRYTLWEAGEGPLTPKEVLRVEKALSRIAVQKVSKLTTLFPGPGGDDGPLAA